SLFSISLNNFFASSSFPIFMYSNASACCKKLSLSAVFIYSLSFSILSIKYFFTFFLLSIFATPKKGEYEDTCLHQQNAGYHGKNSLHRQQHEIFGSWRAIHSESL